MKTMTLILFTAIQIFLATFTFGNNEGVPESANNEMNFSSFLISAPVTPKEATFEEIQLTESLLIAPVTPKEASFDDEAEIPIPYGLAPVTPAEADFNDNEPSMNTSGISVAPVTPTEADFTELQ